MSMKKLLVLMLAAGLLAACGTTDNKKPEAEVEETETKADVEEEKQDESATQRTEEQKPDMKTEAEANAVEYPAKPGAMLYDKVESKYKGMNYHFKGTLVKTEKMEGLLGKMTDALLVKNEQGYVMPIFPPYEITAVKGDEIEAWGPLSGDGYSLSEAGVDNVVGVAGAMNASVINVNDEMQ